METMEFMGQLLDLAQHPEQIGNATLRRAFETVDPDMVRRVIQEMTYSGAATPDKPRKWYRADISYQRTADPCQLPYFASASSTPAAANTFTAGAGGEYIHIYEVVTAPWALFRAVDGAPLTDDAMAAETLGMGFHGVEWRQGSGLPFHRYSFCRGVFTRGALVETIAPPSSGADTGAEVVRKPKRVHPRLVHVP